MRTEKYRYIRNYFDCPYYVDSDWIVRMRDQRDFVEKTFCAPVAREELYAYRVDPEEANNLVDNLDFKEELEELRGRLDAFLSETEDPILNGPIPHPDSLGEFPQWVPNADGTYRLADYEPIQACKEVPFGEFVKSE